jgi:hypothetical protein
VIKHEAICDYTIHLVWKIMNKAVLEGGREINVITCGIDVKRGFPASCYICFSIAGSDKEQGKEES